MKYLIVENLVAIVGFILSSSGILPLIISPYFSFSIAPIASIRKDYFSSLSSVFFLGIINDVFLGIYPGASSIIFLLLHTVVRVISPFIYTRNIFILFATGFFFSLFSGIGYLILPKVGNFLPMDELLKSSIINGAWTPIIFYALNKINLLLEKGKK